MTIELSWSLMATACLGWMLACAFGGLLLWTTPRTQNVRDPGLMLVLTLTFAILAGATVILFGATVIEVVDVHA